MKGYPQYFKQRQIEQYIPSEAETELAKESLIQKKKIESSIYSTLLCIPHNDNSISVSQQEILQNERKKYIQFMRKYYSHKIPQNLKSSAKLKEVIIAYQQKNSEHVKEKNEKLHQNSGIKKRAGNKQKETIVEPKKKVKLNQDKKVAQPLKHQKNIPQQEVHQQLESQSINLVNNLLDREESEQQFNDLEL